MSVGAGYARVYFSILDDEKFDRVYSDDHHLATWLRLLLLAEMAYPNAVSLPHDVRTPSVHVLAEVGLIDLTRRGLFRIHGMQAERERRSAQARNAAAVRWQSASNAPAMRAHSNGSPPAMLAKPSLSEPNRTITSQSDFDRRVEATQRELRRVRGES